MRYVLLLILVLAVSMASSDAVAPVGDDYDLTWHTIDGGSGTSTDGSLELSGTIGQPDAGVLTGADYELAGGFWVASLVTAPCPWDCALPPDGEVGVNDFLILLAQWGQIGVSCDFDGGAVGINDFLKLLGAWGACP